MARIVSPGTFVFVKGATICTDWVIDCEGADVVTQPEVTELVLKYLTATLVDAPKLAAQIAAQQEMERIAKGSGNA